MLAEESTIIEKISEEWRDQKPALLERAGDNQSFPFGGHDIKNNPALRKTLEKIADNLLPLLAEKLEMKNYSAALNRSSQQMIKDHGAKEFAQAVENAQLELRFMDGKMTKQLHSSYQMLLRHDSGIEQEMERMQSLGATPDKECRTKIAAQILAATIKSLVLCCHSSLPEKFDYIRLVPTSEKISPHRPAVCQL